MVKVSVVVPVYNVEDYIRDCLDSIVNQTLKDIEIICVNDGSPDNSLEILREYEAKDDRITVIDQENGGHAVATNRGIELAKGECLFCMDSDDVLELTALEHSYDRLKERDVDFVMFKAINYVDAEDRYYETEVYSMQKIYRKVGSDVFNYKDIGDLMFQASVTPWSKLYKRDFINRENIRFPEGLIFEDNVFFYKALLTAKRICFLNEFLFIRRWYSTSSTMNGDLRFISSIGVSNLVIETFRENHEFDNYKKHLLNNKIKNNYMRYNNLKKPFKEEYFQALKEDFIKILNDKKYYLDFINSVSYRHRRIFEQVIISENHIEFDQIRKTYDEEMTNYYHLDKNVFNVIINAFDKMTHKKQLNQRKIFEDNQQQLKEILEDEYFYKIFFLNLNSYNRTIFQQMLISENLEEYLSLRKLIKVTKKQTREYENTKILKENKLKERRKYNSLINSNSWKYTKVIRMCE